jgi:RiboL-PSP-HEPN
MSIARSNFVNRISVLRDSLGDSALADGPPANIQKNAVAAMLRNGLAVLAFAIIEDFIRDRTAEILNSFSSTTVKFDDLSEDLQQAITVSALNGILFKSKYQEKNNKIPWILAQLPPIASATTNITNLSKYSFGQSASNIADDEPAKILGAFGVAGGWNAIAATARRIGLGGALDYAQAFKDIAKRRHSAAHDTTTKIPLNDLINSVKTIIAICCSFDLLLSKALAIHNTGNIPDKKHSPVSEATLTLRFVSPHPKQVGKFREQVELPNSSKLHTKRVFATLLLAKAAAGKSASEKNAFLIFLESNGVPQTWETW